MKKTIITILIIIFIPLYSCRLHHDLALWKFTNWNYKNISHPKNTKRILIESKVGLFGNGNHCDFRIFEARSYNIDDKDKLIQFYQNKFLETNREYGKVRIGFYFPERYKEFNFDQRQKWLLDAESRTKEPIYILTVSFVYSDGWIIFPLADLRCM